MKILIISPGMDMYGSERSITSAIKSTENIEPVFLTLAGANVARAWRELGFEVVETRFPTKPIYAAPATHFKLLLFTYRLIIKIRPDVLVINLDGSSALFSIAAKLAGVPILQFQRFEIVDRISIGAQLAFFLSNNIICPSKTVAAQVKSLLPRQHRSKVIARYNPISQPSGQLQSHNSGIHLPPSQSDKNSLVFGYIGRICSGKGIETLIDAASILKRRGVGCRILIAGQPSLDGHGNSYMRGLESRRDALDLALNVEFLGYFSDSREFFEKIDVAILPSLSESFGRALAEAWANGLPSICSDIPALKEINDLSGGGLLFQAGNPADLARAMCEALNDRFHLEVLASSGRQWVQQACSEHEYGRFFQYVLDNLSRTTTHNSRLPQRQ